MDINHASSSNGILSKILDFLHIDNSLKNTLDPSKYEKGKVDFDGITRKSIVEVIPTYLSKILSTLNGKDEIRFDYDKGTFRTTKEIKQSRDDITRRAAESAGYDLKDEFEKFTRGRKDQDELIKNLNEFFVKSVEKGEKFNYRKEQSDEDLKSFGLDPKTGRLLIDLLKDLEKRNKGGRILNFNKDIAIARENITDQYKRIEQEGGNILNYLYNNSIDSGDSLSSSPLNLNNIYDKYHNNVFYYLQGIYRFTQHVSDNIENIGGGGGPTPGDGTPLSGSSTRTFKKIRSIKNNTPKEEKKTVNDYSESEYEDLLLQITRLDREIHTSNSSFSDIKKRTQYNDINKIIVPYQEYKNMSQEAKDKYISKLLEEKKKLEKYKEKEKEDKNKEPKGVVGKLINGIHKILNKPAEVATDVLNWGNQKLLDIIYGKDRDENKGFLDIIIDETKKLFSKFGKWADENIFKKFNLGTIKENFDKLFGEKGKDGKRHGGWFGNVGNEVVENFKSAGRWVRDSFGDVGGKVKDFFTGKDKSNAYSGGNVTKTGLIAVSEGELIIPSELNPYYKGKTDKNKQKRDETNIVNKFFGKFDGGGVTPDGTEAGKNADKEAKSDFKKVVNLKKEKVNKVKHQFTDFFNKYILGTEEDPGIGRKAAKNVASGASNIFDQLFGSKDEDKKKEQEKVKKSIGDIVKEFCKSENFSSMITGGLIGGGVSLLTGGIVSPILAASVGSAIGLTLKSKKVQEKLFGVEDEDGNQIEKGLLPKKVADFVKTDLPDVAKFGTVGGVGGLLGILPGGTVGGIVLGSALGFATKSQWLKDKIFGTDTQMGLISKETQKKIKEAAPNMAVGAAAGLVAGPFGVVGNILLGSAIGYATSSEEFKDKLFGKADKDGKRSGGGILTFIREKVLNPLNETITTIAQELKFQMKSMFKSIGRIINNALKDLIIIPVQKAFKDLILSPLGKVAKVLLAPVAGIGIGAFKAVTGVGTLLKKKQIKRGQASNMTAAERLKYREDKGMGRDATFQFDELISDMSKDDLSELRERIRAVQDPNKELRKESNKKLNEISGRLSVDDTLSTMQIHKVTSLVRKGETDKALKLLTKYAEKKNMNPDKLEELKNNILNDATAYNDLKDQQLDTTNYTQRKINELKEKYGIKINSKNAWKFEDLLKAEIGDRDSKEKVKTPEMEQEDEHHKEIIKNMDKQSNILEDIKKILQNIIDVEKSKTIEYEQPEDIIDNKKVNPNKSSESDNDNPLNKNENDNEEEIGIDIGGARLYPKPKFLKSIFKKINGLFSKKDKDNEDIHYSSTAAGKMIKHVKNGQGEYVPAINDSNTSKVLKEQQELNDAQISTARSLSGLGGTLTSIFSKLFNNNDEENKTETILDKIKEGLSTAWDKVVDFATGGRLEDILKTASSTVVTALLAGLTIKAFLGSETIEKFVDKIKQLITGGNKGDGDYYSDNRTDTVDVNGKTYKIQVDENGNPIKDGDGNYVAANGNIIYGSSGQWVTEEKSGRTLQSRLIEGEARGIAKSKILLDDKNRFAGIKTRPTVAKKMIQRVTDNKIVKSVAKGASNTAKSVSKFVSKKLPRSMQTKMRATKGIGKRFNILTTKNISNEAKEVAEAGLTRNFKTLIDDAVKKFVKIFTKIPVLRRFLPQADNIAVTLSDDIAKAAAKATSKVATNLVSTLSTALVALKIAFVITDFYTGYEDARTTFGIIERPTEGQRIISGLIRALKNSVPIVGALISDKALVDIFVNRIAPIMGIDTTDLERQREEATNEVAEYNRTHDTDYTIEEYNKKVLKDYTTTEKVGNFVRSVKKNIKEKGVVGAIKSGTEEYVEDKVDIFKKNFEEGGPIQAIAETVGAILPGYIGDGAKGTIYLGEMALKGKVGELIKYSPNKDDPNGNFLTNLLGHISVLVPKISLLPVALISAGVQKILEVLNLDSFDDLKNIGSDLLSVGKYAITGEIGQMWGTGNSNEEDSTFASIVKNIGLAIPKISLTPIALVTTGVRKVLEVLNLDSFEDLKTLGTDIITIGKYAITGQMGEMLKMGSSNEEDGKFASIVKKLGLGLPKYLLTPTALVTTGVRKVLEVLNLDSFEDLKNVGKDLLSVRKNAIAGNISQMWKVSGTNEGDGKFASIMKNIGLGIPKILLTPTAIVNAGINKVLDILGIDNLGKSLLNYGGDLITMGKYALTGNLEKLSSTGSDNGDKDEGFARVFKKLGTFIPKMALMPTAFITASIKKVIELLGLDSLENLKNFGSEILSVGKYAFTGQIGEMYKVDHSNEDDNAFVKFTKNLGLAIPKISLTPIALITTGIRKSLEVLNLDSFEDLKNVGKDILSVGKYAITGEIGQMFRMRSSNEEDGKIAHIFKTLALTMPKVSLTPIALVTTGIKTALKVLNLDSFEDLKNIGSDLLSVGKYAITGEIGQMWKVNGTNEGDNTFASIVKNIGLAIPKISLTPIALLTTGVKTTLKNLNLDSIEDLKNLGSDILSVAKYGITGEFGQMWKMGSSNEEDGKFASIVKTLALSMPKVSLTPIALITTGVRKVLETLNLDSFSDLQNLGEDVLTIGKYAFTGHIGKMFATGSSNQNDNGLAAFTKNLGLTIPKFALLVPAVVTSTVRFAVDKITSGINAIKKAADIEGVKGEIEKVESFKDLYAIKNTVDDDNPFKPLNSVAIGITKLLYTPVLAVKKMINILPSLIDGIKKKFEDIWGDIEEFIDDPYGFIKKTVKEKAKNVEEKAKNVEEKAKNAAGKVGNVIEDGISAGKEFISNIIPGGKNSGLKYIGGSSGFVSQLDPQYSNSRYGSGNVAQEGCGPAVATMAVNNVLGNGSNVVSMKDSLAYAKRNNYEQANGTSADYFGDMFNQYGLESEYTKNINGNKSNDIKNKLARGSSVVLLGQDKNNNSKVNSPFGPNNHYVLATGLDKNNNVIVNDPEMNQPTVYDNKILDNANLAISTQDNIGAGSRIARKAARRFKVYIGGAASAEKLIFDFLTDSSNGLGLNAAAASGILANIYKESSFRTGALGDNGTSYGICQWHNSRYSSLKSWCSSNGLDYTTLDGQLRYLEHELKTGYKSMLSKFKKAPNTAQGAYDVGYTWCYDFERPANRSAKSVERGNLAKTQFFPKYKGQTGKYNKAAASVAFGASNASYSDTTTTSSSSSSEESSSSSKSAFSNLSSLFGGLLGSYYGDTVSSLLGFSSNSNSDLSSDDSNLTTYEGVAEGGPGNDKQKALVAAMKSKLGKLTYSMNGPRNPDKGSADCSSTVNWAYKKVFGIDIGNNTASILDDSDTKIVQVDSTAKESSGTTTSKGPKESGLQPGDILLYSRPTSGYTVGRKYRVGHVEMYAGDGKRIGHGGGKGPKLTDLSKDSKRFIMAKRLQDVGSGSGIYDSRNYINTKHQTGSIMSIGGNSEIYSQERLLKDKAKAAIRNINVGKGTSKSDETMITLVRSILGILTTMANNSSKINTIVELLQNYFNAKNNSNNKATTTTSRKSTTTISNTSTDLDKATKELVDYLNSLAV